MPSTKPPYPPEFRREAVELVRVSGKPIARLASDLGVSDQTLRNWVKQADRHGAGVPARGPTYILRAYQVILAV